jgi:hypothetical protein
MTLKAEGWDGKLSYSSFNLYMSCNRKYYLSKVAKCPIDSDASTDTTPFNFGKAFHKLLEIVNHDVSQITKRTIDEVCEFYNLPKEEHGPHLFALLRHFKKIQAKNGLVATHCEVEITTPEFRGYIDVILKEADGNGWWIGDMKTASSYTQFTNSKLHSDWQLNLYTKHLPQICEATGYKEEDFKGCRYLLNVKSRLRPKKDDDFRSYAERLEAAITSFDIPVSKDELQPDTVYYIFKMAYKEIQSLHKMKDAQKYALPNFNCCTSYFKACEFWSQCHGKTFSELKEREVIASA